MTPPAPVQPKLGRYGTFGIGRQTAPGAAVAPEHFLRWNGGSTPTATVDVKDDNFANASIFPMAGRAQGRKLDSKNVQFEVEHVGLVLLLELLLGGTVTGGIITPSGLNYADNMPLRPATIEANMPGSPTRVVDAQFNKLSLTMQNRANFTGQADYMAVSSGDMVDPAPAVLPIADIYQFKDHFIEWNGGSANPESSSLNLEAGIAAIDAARGDQASAADFILGFERSGLLSLGGQFGVAGVPASMLEAYRSQASFPLAWVLRKYGPVPQGGGPRPVAREIKFTVPNAQLSMMEPPMGLDRIVTPVTWKAVSLGGEVPFTVNVT